MKDISDRDNRKEGGRKEEFPVINPSFVPEPGIDSVENSPKGEECPHYSEPLPIDKPTEIGGNSIKEF